MKKSVAKCVSRSSAASSAEAVVEGAISNIVDFGAFVDLDGIDGLIHISELSWSHVNHPSEVVSIGDVVKVKVLDIDHDRQRISLGLKQTQEDPWQKVIDTHAIGDVLEGTVTKIVSFGAFVEIYNGVEGLVHISELSEQHVENPRQVLNEGDVVRVRILEIDTERRRLSLSAKQVEGQNLIPTEIAGSEEAAPAAEGAEATEAAVDADLDAIAEGEAVIDEAIEEAAAEEIAEEVVAVAEVEAAIEEQVAADVAEVEAIEEVIDEAIASGELNAEEVAQAEVLEEQLEEELVEEIVEAAAVEGASKRPSRKTRRRSPKR